MVENQVATLTAATSATNAAIPPFKSSYPASSPAPPQSSSHSSHSHSNRQSTTSALAGLPSNDRYLLVAGPTGSSLTVNLEDTAGIWLSQLDSQLGIEEIARASLGSSPFSAAGPPVTTNGVARVKLEPTPVVLAPSFGGQFPSSSALLGNPSGVVAGSYVPPLPHSIFLPVSMSTADATQVTPPGSSATLEYPDSPASPPTQFELPQVTPALLQYLPSSAAVRKRYLEGLYDAMMVHPGFNFRHFEQRIEAMITWGENNNNDSRAKSELAREIFGAANNGTSKKVPNKEKSAPTSPKPTLSFFSATCAAFALGAIMAPQSGEASSVGAFRDANESGEPRDRQQGCFS